MKVDIGGGEAPAADHVNLDPVHGEGAWRRFAQQTPWPADDATVDAIHASHVLEHIPAGDERIAVFNEAWRVAAFGATFTIVVPVLRTQAGQVSWEAIADPTHVSFWCKESFDYFCTKRAQADYHILWWRRVSYVEDGAIATCVLTKEAP